MKRRSPRRQPGSKPSSPTRPRTPAVDLVLAPGFDAKSAVGPDGVPVLLLAVDSLALEDADLGILLPHEFAATPTTPAAPGCSMTG